MDKIIFLTLILFLFAFPSSISAQVVINEFSPASTPEWVELYNNSTETVSLSGYTIHFHIDLEKQKYTFCSDDQLSGNSFKLVMLPSIPSMLNNNGDTITLTNNGSTEDTISYGSGELLSNIVSGQSGKREPNGSLNWVVSDNPSQNGDVATFECASNDTTTAVTATYKINQPKDENGGSLSSVEIYVDDIYVHHHDDQILEFCNGCSCNGYVSCGFGTHTIKMKKNGYEDWTEAIALNSGDYKEANPILSLIPVSATNTEPTLTSTPTPSGSSFKVSLPLSRTPTSKKDEVESNEHDLEVLGVQQVADENETDDAPETEEKKQKLSPSVILFILAGAIFIGLAVFLFMKQRKQEQKGHGGKKEHTKAD